MARLAGGVHLLRRAVVRDRSQLCFARRCVAAILVAMARLATFDSIDTDQYKSISLLIQYNNYIIAAYAASFNNSLNAPKTAVRKSLHSIGPGQLIQLIIDIL